MGMEETARQDRANPHGRVHGAMAAAIVALGLAGCGAEEAINLAPVAYPAPLFAADVATMSVTGGKTIVDNLYSFISGQDCSTVRAIDGGYYCRERLPDNRIIETQLFCYRTLAKITCYDQPMPYMRNQQVAPSGHPVGARTRQVAN